MSRCLRKTALGIGGEEEQKRLEARRERIMEKREKLLDKMLDGMIPDELFQRKDSSMEEEYREVQQKILSLEAYRKKRRMKKNRIEELKNEVVVITNKDLSTKQLIDRIERIVVHRSYAQVEFDFFEPVRIYIERKGYKTVLFKVQ